MRKNLKKLTALTLTAAMTMASAMTAFAANSGDYDGSGDYEGGEMEYPAIKVTVPVTASVDVSYIADPNDLIKSTLSGDVAAKDEYKNYTFSGDTGIYFKTKEKSGDPSTTGTKGEYSSKSQPLKFINESAQDVQMTVTLSKTSEASGDVVYADTGVFENSDTENKLYLAISDGTSTEALGASPATITAELKGQKDNFEPTYDTMGSKYEYTQKADLAVDWTESTYELSGAVNKNAKWDEKIGFPDIRVTYSFAEAPADAAPSIAVKEYTVTAGQPVTVNMDMGRGALEAKGVASILNGYSNTNVNESLFTYADGKLTFAGGLSTWFKGKGVSSANLTITFNNSAKTKEVIKLTIK